MTVYFYTNDTWIDRQSDLEFEAYNSVGWPQNGTASSIEELLCDVLIADIVKKDGLNDQDIILNFNPYEDLTVGELQKILDKRQINIVCADYV